MASLRTASSCLQRKGCSRASKQQEHQKEMSERPRDDCCSNKVQMLNGDIPNSKSKLFKRCQPYSTMRTEKKTIKIAQNQMRTPQFSKTEVKRCQPYSTMRTEKKTIKIAQNQMRTPQLFILFTRRMYLYTEYIIAIEMFDSAHI
ncbi:hypothetical protein HELRODRAFT_173206 [Helobdella robusta]|uniref:Uncharacterized protein n=1 Tax=Helobdella robusta TaxID=6412 RepID=T1F6K4_HELRO|nr:hypothetical protein HELRODRAFT_173206 [Helobdella robusta]ESO04118.1 hypothetical protein HELRODRAFT_173206 [Helobdella robusta]